MESTDIQECDAPLWLDAEFLTNILSNEGGSSIILTKYDIKPAVPKGENFLGTLYRVAVEYKNETDNSFKKYIIIKIVPTEEETKAFLTQIKAFQKELLMYGSVFPMMDNIMKRIEGNVFPFSALLFPTDRPETIVLEDLKYLGYKMADRLTGLNQEHCLATVRKLARFHALSRKLFSANPEIIDMFRIGFFERNDENYKLLHPYFEKKLINLASKIEEWPSFKHYADKVRKLSTKAYDLIIDAALPNEEGSFNVLNHGDCWVNNLMFKYHPETGEIVDVRFVDFQLSTISSPSLDLQYFINTSTADEIRFKQRETLLEVYHAELVRTMDIYNMNCGQFTLSQLKEDFEEKNIFGFIASCVDLSDMVADKSKSLAKLENDSNDQIDIQTEKIAKDSRWRFRYIFQQMLIYYDKKGLL